MRVLVVDAANVIGSVPDGWWKDRPGAARRLHTGLVGAQLDADRVVLVLEGRARAGVPEGTDGRVETVHAPASGDDEVVAQVEALSGHDVTIASADRELLARIPGAVPLGPRTLRTALHQ
ncbi:MAG TPA: hypothetical protein GXZ45_04335 [Propionibacterium sp.]|nr:hypothetical protein [Propionibacterium sp.]